MENLKSTKASSIIFKPSIENIISGEKFELLCDLIIGNPEDISYNPVISKNIKNKKIEFIPIMKLIAYPDNIFDNPKYIFIYTHHIHIFNLKLVNKLKNNFVLVSHNSDQNIVCLYEVKNILESDKLIKWWSQNLNISETYSSKIGFLPIGIANIMWNHGNPVLFKKYFTEIEIIFTTTLNNLTENDNGNNNDNNNDNDNDNEKDRDNIETQMIYHNNLIMHRLDNFIRNCKKYDFYFSFSSGTNKFAREECINKISKYITFTQPKLSPSEYIKHLPEYKMAICPIGNGLDTHRLWECFYCGVVPIVVKTELNMNISKYIPIIILNSWDNFNIDDIMKQYKCIMGDNLYNGLYICNKWLWFSTWEKIIKNI